MNGFLSPAQEKARAEFREFADTHIVQRADEFDRQERTSPEVIREIAARGYLGAVIPGKFGGLGMDMVSFGLLNEETGRACSSLRSLLTVHSMVAFAILRWGTDNQRALWLPKLAKGECIGAFALSEPNCGSDARHIETTAVPCNEGFVLTGRKKWITYGQIADLYLVFAQVEGKSTAFLVERDRSGLEVVAITGMLGTRGSMLGEVHLSQCRIPKANLLGGCGFGVSAVALSALDLGRYSVAWGCVGIGQACLEASLKYASERTQFGQPLKEHQLIKEMIANMVTNVKAARLLCYQAGHLKDGGAPSATAETMVAKYFSSMMSVRAAGDAVQIHGANGCSSCYPVQRFLRDAKIMEVIEGSNQMQQIMICSDAYSSAC